MENAASWQPERLRCERLVDPTPIGTTRPNLSWQMPRGDTSDSADACQVRIAGTREALGADSLSWQSAWLANNVGRWRYAGPALASRDERWWTVRVRTREGIEGPWASPARFAVGLLQREEWQATWIRRPDQSSGKRSAYFIRRRFAVDTLPVRAYAYVSGLGVARSAVNGHAVGDGLLRPGWTDYRRRVQYDRIDFSAQLIAGENVFATEIAPGWYSGRIATHASADAPYVPIPEFLAQIELELPTGERITIPTDESWEWAPSPILSSDLYDGEDWDLRLADAAFADTASAFQWDHVECSTGTAGELVVPRAAPVRVLRSAPARQEWRSDGTVLLDSGCNDTGFLELVVSEPAGRRIEVSYGELLDPAGNLHRDNLRSARCMDTFICSGRDEERLAPAFSYRGYRYAEVRGLSAPEHLRSARALTISSDMKRTGWFRSGAIALERIYDLMVSSLQANYVEVPTDCPQRDERMGWLADALLFAPIAAYTFDISAFMAKWFADIRDARTPEGAFPDIAPRPSARWPGRSFDPGAPGWGDAGILLPWLMYERYGDDEVLAEMFPAMLRHLDLIHRANPDGIWRAGRGKDYGDWVPAGPDTSHDLFGTCWLYRSTAVAAQIAGLLGRGDEHRRLADLAEHVQSAFQDSYVEKDNGRVRDLAPTGSLAASAFAPLLASETQTGYVMALALGLIEGELATRAGNHLAALVRASGGRLRTGFCGSAFLPAVLERVGHADLAYDLLLQEEPPSLGFMAKMGATSVWERWDGLDNEGWPACPTMNSFNHYAMSSMLSWLVEGVCGLRPKPGVPALSEILFAPAVSRQIPSAEFRFDAPSGHLELAWEWIDAQRIRGRLCVPPGMSAEIAQMLAVDGEPHAARRRDVSDGVMEAVSAGVHEILWEIP